MRYEDYIKYMYYFWESANKGIFGTPEEVVKMLASLGNTEAQAILNLNIKNI